MKQSLVVFCVVWQTVHCVDPSLIQNFSCKKSNPEYEKCFMETIKRYMPFITKGIPSLGIPSLDPLNIAELSINQTLAGMADIKATFTNLEVLGIRNTVFDSIKLDPINLYGSIKASVPWVSVETDYDVEGKIMGTLIQNKGHFEGNFTGVKLTVKTSFITYTKEDGLDYFKINKLSQNLMIDDGYIRLTSKDKKFQPTVDLMSQFFNNNPTFVLKYFGPIFSNSSVSMINTQLNRVLGTFPASVWLPE